ncbi:MAG: hypothetical protein MHM6MM_002717 [Cercozoa sp. M6MM]
MDDNDYSDDGDIFGLESGSESESDSASELSAANADEDEAADEQREIDEEDEDKDEALLQEAPEDEEESEEVEPRPETVPALQWSRSAKQQFTALSEVCFDTEVVRQLLESKLPPNAVVSKETALAASALTKMAILKILQKTAQQRREAKRRRKECKLGEPVPKKRKPARRITAADISNTLLNGGADEFLHLSRPEQPELRPAPLSRTGSLFSRRM